MNTIDSEIKIVRTGSTITYISFTIPVYTEHSFDGSIKVNIPYMCNSFWVNDMLEVNKAVEESMMGDCILAEKCGKGMEKELEAIGWIITEKTATTCVLKFNSSVVDKDINRALRKSGSYVHQNLQVA